MTTATKTAAARKLHAQMVQLRADFVEVRSSLAAVRDELARGDFDNEVEQGEYEASEDFLSAEHNRLIEAIVQLKAGARKAGLGELLDQIDHDHIMSQPVAA